MAKLIRTALLIALAVTVNPGAAAGQYSWSNFSVSLGFGTGGVALGFGSSYASVDPWYDYAYTDPCWDYGYYEQYWYDCPFDFERIHGRRSYVSVDYRYPYRPSYYRPYGYYGYSSYTHFSVDLGLHFGFGYGSSYYRPYRYPAYRYASYGYGPYYGYPNHGVVVYPRARTAAVAVRPSRGYRTSPLVRPSPLYKESPRGNGQRTATARSVTSGTTVATRSVSDRPAGPTVPARAKPAHWAKFRCRSSTRRPDSTVGSSNTRWRGPADQRARRCPPERHAYAPLPVHSDHHDPPIAL